MKKESTANHNYEIGKWYVTGEPCWSNISLVQKLLNLIKKLWKTLT